MQVYSMCLQMNSEKNTRLSPEQINVWLSSSVNVLGDYRRRMETIWQIMSVSVKVKLPPLLDIIAATTNICAPHHTHHPDEVIPTLVLFPPPLIPSCTPAEVWFQMEKLMGE